MSEQRKESGQVLVLIILAIVGLFGFAALAVDLGRLYAERRRIQSAADAAALAAAYAAAESRDYQAAAIQSFGLNDVFDTDLNENPDMRIDVEVYHPALTGPYSDSTRDDYDQYYQVLVRSEVDPIFAQFVYGGPLEVTVEAIGRYVTASGLYAGDVLHALSSNSCKALWFTGTGETILTGGNAFSDSLAGSGGSIDSCTPDDVQGGCASGVQGGSGDVIIPDGTLYTSGPWLENGNAGNVDVDGGIIQCTPPRTQQYLPEPDCSSLPNREYTGGSGTLQPGIYNDGIKVTGKNTVLNLAPGMYCLDSDFIMNGGIVTGYGVMIYMHGGSFQLGGSTTVNLMAANSETIDPDANDEINNWTGMLVYMTYDNTGEVHIGGGSGSSYTGTIYAPGPRATEGQDKCVIEGTGTSIGLNSNVICYTIKVAGSAAVNIDYDEDTTYRLPPSVDLSQ